MTASTVVKNTAFYALVAIIIVVAVFPFYYAILTSFKSGTALFEINYLPKSFSFGNYADVLANDSFLRNLGNSLMVAACISASLASRFENATTSISPHIASVEST